MYTKKKKTGSRPDVVCLCFFLAEERFSVVGISMENAKNKGLYTIIAYRVTIVHRLYRHLLIVDYAFFAQ